MEKDELFQQAVYNGDQSLVNKLITKHKISKHIMNQVANEIILLNYPYTNLDKSSIPAFRKWIFTKLLELDGVDEYEILNAVENKDVDILDLLLSTPSQNNNIINYGKELLIMATKSLEVSLISYKKNHEDIEIRKSILVKLLQDKKVLMSFDDAMHHYIKEVTDKYQDYIKSLAK